MINLRLVDVFESWTSGKLYFFFQKKVSSGRVEHSEQSYTKKTFLERFIRTGERARITFGTMVKIAGKYDFFKFCEPHIPI